MNDLPLHPILVHFPIALGLLLPFVILLIVIGIHKHWFSDFTWILVPMLLAVIVGTGWRAMEAGEDDEELVEKIVSEKSIEAHEEFAELFWRGAIGLFVLSLVPLGMGKGKGRALVKTTVVVGSLGLLWPLVNTGHSGGELVYHLGAGAAHVGKYKDEAVVAPGGDQPQGERDSDSD